MSRKFIRWAAVMAFLILLHGALLWLPGWMMVRRLEDRYDIEIDGTIRPIRLWPGHFEIRNLGVDWRDQFRILSGTLEIEIDAASLFSSEKSLSIVGHGLEIELGDGFPIPSKTSRVQINRFDATVLIPNTGDPIIHSLNFESPQVQIHINPK